MKKVITLSILSLLFTFCSQEKKILRQAANSVERSEYEKAVGLYDQLIQKDNNSFFGNAGKGIVLSEFMGRHEQALPYLENALKNTPDKTKPILHKNLGKSYHFVGNYERALYYYKKSEKDNDPTWADYDAFLSKRIADCRFAIEHPRVAPPENQQIVNAGTGINTEFPEYTPVVLGDKMYFTSKRQDNPKEKRNGEDGKFFEAIYVADIKADGSISNPVRYTIPKSAKGGEAVLSATPDGKKLLIYKSGKIYESDVNSTDHATTQLDKHINFSSLQDHASLSPDGKTIYFTSDSEKGYGGTDIFMATKNEDGSWSETKLLDRTINTEYDEESPFITESGTLYFASNGHPGYGGFDVYKTHLVNGAWAQAENLGQPINSPGDDIYFSLYPNSSKGYYASARPGGHGDLDIYKVHYVSSEVTPCQKDEQLSIANDPDPSNPMVQTISINVPDNYRDKIKSYRWEINGQTLPETNASFKHTFTKADKYQVSAQLVVYCDSCPNLVAKCAVKEVEVKQPEILTQENSSNENQPGSHTLTNNKKGKNSKDKNSTLASAKTTKGKNAGTDNQNGAVTSENPANTTSESDEASVGNSIAEKGRNGKTVSGPASSGTYAGTEANMLTESELLAINWDAKPGLFELNQSDINDNTAKMLDQNINVLKSNKDLQLHITGHADSRGSNAYNKQLSLQRAKEVQKYFTSHGVAKSRIKSVEGKGEEELVNQCGDGSNCSEEQHSENRRVIIRVSAPQRGTITSK